MILVEKQAGFTLLEMLLSVAIIGMIGAIGAPLLISEQSRNELDIATDHLVQSLRRAQTLAQNQQGDSSWGVYAASSTVVIFQGDSYAARDSDFDEVYVVAENISFSDNEEYVFSKFFGEIASAGTTTLSLPNNDTRQVAINERGVVNKIIGGEVGDSEPDPEPEPEPDPDPDENEVEYDVAIWLDWGTGYCANVNITTDSAIPVTWLVNVSLATEPTNGIPYNIWNVNWSFSSSILTASGVSWNDEVSASSPQSFGYCANR